MSWLFTLVIAWLTAVQHLEEILYHILLILKNIQIQNLIFDFYWMHIFPCHHEAKTYKANSWKVTDYICQLFITTKTIQDNHQIKKKGWFVLTVSSYIIVKRQNFESCNKSVIIQWYNMVSYGNRCNSGYGDLALLVPRAVPKLVDAWHEPNH